MDDLVKRTISSIILFSLFIGAIFTTSLFFSLFFLFITFCMFFEWQGLVLPKLSFFLKLIFSFIYIGTILLLDELFDFGAFGWMTLICLMLAYGGVIRSHAKQFEYSLSFFGIIYIFIFCHSLFAIRFDFTEGPNLVFLAFLIVWSVDVAAFFVGSFFKGPKIAPKISPSKTWSGLIGGMIVATIVYQLCISYWINQDVSFVWMVPLLAVLADRKSVV